MERLKRQVEFIVEIDKLKHIFRQSVLVDKSRNENDAEHSWHIATMAMLFSEYSEDQNMDLLRVLKMLLIHDLVEIDAGDTYCYDEKGYEDKAEREQKAADRIFNILPKDQAQEVYELWTEFEEVETSEAKFAACLDRLEPVILNYNTKGHTWQRPGITSEKVFKRVSILEKNAPKLWEYAKWMINDSIEKGYLKA